MARLTLAATIPVPAAGTYTTATIEVGDDADLTFFSIFDYGSGGTTFKTFWQTSLDGGTTWMDVASHAFATTDAAKASSVSARAALTTPVTPGDGVLADNTSVDGVIGDKVRAKYIVAGTYVASTIALYVQTKD